jgi:hypothetical protein
VKSKQTQEPVSIARLREIVTDQRRALNEASASLLGVDNLILEGRLHEAEAAYERAVQSLNRGWPSANGAGLRIAQSMTRERRLGCDNQSSKQESSQ